MSVQVRWFAGAAEAAGCEEETVDVAAAPAGASVLEVVTSVHPDAAAVVARCTFLADGRGVRRDDAFDPAWRTLDVLPPFAGG